MEQYLIDELIHKAECYAAINHFRLTHYLIRDVYYTSTSLIKSVAFRVHSLPAHEYIGEILVPTDKFKSFDDIYTSCLHSINLCNSINSQEMEEKELCILMWRKSKK